MKLILEKNWWWIYSLVSGLAMVFYLLSWTHLEVDPATSKIPVEIIVMGALSSALFYMILRWPKEYRKSPYRFATLYGAILSAGAYVIQCQSISVLSSNFWPWMLLLSAIAVAMLYAPGALIRQLHGGIRNFYLAKTLAVAWCWTIWALLPLMFLGATHLQTYLGVSFLFIAGMVIITDVLDGSDRNLFLGRKWMWISTIVGLLALGEIIIHLQFIHKIEPFGLILSAIPALIVAQTRHKLLAAFLVDCGLVFWCVFLTWSQWSNTLP